MRPDLSARIGRESDALALRLLGPFEIRRAGDAQPLPASRKVRGLVAYLALAPRAVTREHLCELLWDAPSDPRGELRWCLSKARALLDAPRRRRIQTSAGSVALDLHDCPVDALEVERALQSGLGTLAPQRLRDLLALFAGDFLEGLEIERSARFSGWLLAQRRRLRAARIALLERLARSVPRTSDEALGCLEAWIALAPFDRQAHELLLRAFAELGRLREGDEHLAATAPRFEIEGLDWRPLGVAWRLAREQRHQQPGLPSSSVAVEPRHAVSTDGPRHDDAVVLTRRASLAVMPFVEATAQPKELQQRRGGLAAGFAHDLITRFAKLRSLDVIAPGTMFALEERKLGAHDAARTLNADYLVSGSIEQRAGRLNVNVELIEARNARVLWADDFEREADDALSVLHDIGDGVVASIASEIEAAECQRAILKSPNSLDAWDALHRGLWHMYRFDRADNEHARRCFELALRLDPNFSRALAGLSFTHWQDAFQHWVDPKPAIERAYRAADLSLLADERDPAAHWALGRALWLRGQQSQSLAELDAAVELSPSFAQGHYTLAFVHSQSGDPQLAIRSADLSRHLSPFDPLLFGMLGARALALVRLGRFEEAAEWALKAAARPNAHVYIHAIAALCLALAEKDADARHYIDSIRSQTPGWRAADFFSAFHFSDEARAPFRRAMRRLGVR